MFPTNMNKMYCEDRLTSGMWFYKSLNLNKVFATLCYTAVKWAGCWGTPLSAATVNSVASQVALCETRSFHRLSLLDCDAMYCGRNLPTLQWNMLPPSSTLNTQAVHFSETLVNFYQNTWYHMPENRHFTVVLLLTFLIQECTFLRPIITVEIPNCQMTSHCLYWQRGLMKPQMEEWTTLYDRQWKYGHRGKLGFLQISVLSSSRNSHEL